MQVANSSHNPDSATIATGPAPGLAAGAESGRGELAPFRAVRLLGHGGMGMVWLAEQLQPVQRLLALKVASGPLTARLRGWFEVERHALARMRHPGIAQLLDAGELADGRPYFAMEYVEGVPITQWCARTRPSLRARVELLQRICLAVQHAHGKGLVHRDLKPGNLLVVEVDGVAQPKLIDFGVASAIAVRGQVAGTPGYMSPEQAGGDDQVDTRSDVYALGVVMAEVLFGLPPVRSGERAGAVVSWQSLPLGERTSTAQTLGLSPSRLERALRDDLGPLIDTCTATDPARRCASAQELGDELGRWLAGRPLVLRQHDRWYVWRTTVRRHRWWLLAALLFMAGLGTALALALQARAEAERQRDVAETARAEADRQARIASSVNRFLTEDLLGAANLDTHPQAETLTVRQLLEDSAQRLLATRQLEPEAAADILDALGRTLAALGRYALAQQAFERTAQHRALRSGKDHPRTLGARVAAANARIDQSDRTVGESLEDLLATIARLDPPAPALHAWTEYVLARHLTFAGDYARALELIHSALARKALGGREQDKLREQLAWTLSRSGLHEPAVAVQRELLAETEKRHGADSWPVLVVRGGLATTLQRAGLLDDALQQREAVLAAYASRFPEHAERGVQHSHYASLLVVLGRHREAAESARSAIRILVHHYGEDHRVLGNAWSHLGAALLGLGQPAQALTALTNADRIYRSQVASDHPLRLTNDARLRQAQAQAALE